ncbi:hypothetical protein [Nostoc sp.]
MSKLLGVPSSELKASPSEHGISRLELDASGSEHQRPRSKGK